MRRNRSSFSFPDFSLRRLLLQGARAARGSPTLGNRCDLEKGPSSSSKGEKASSTSSNKVSCHRFFFARFLRGKFYRELNSGGERFRSRPQCLAVQGSLRKNSEQLGIPSGVKADPATEALNHQLNPSTELSFVCFLFNIYVSEARQSNIGMIDSLPLNG